MKYTKNVVDANLREQVFSNLFADCATMPYCKINDRQFGIILTDKNGHERYVRIGAIVAEEREDMTARELMRREIEEYEAKQAAKAEKAVKRAAKAEADKTKREAKAREKGE